MQSNNKNSIIEPKVQFEDKDYLLYPDSELKFRYKIKKNTFLGYPVFNLIQYHLKMNVNGKITILQSINNGFWRRIDIDDNSVAILEIIDDYIIFNWGLTRDFQFEIIQNEDDDEYKEIDNEMARKIVIEKENFIMTPSKTVQYVYKFRDRFWYGDYTNTRYYKVIMKDDGYYDLNFREDRDDKDLKDFSFSDLKDFELNIDFNL